MNIGFSVYIEVVLFQDKAIGFQDSDPFHPFNQPFLKDSTVK